MTASLKVRNVSLELLHDLQRESARPSSLLASLSGTERRYATLLSGIDFEAREGDRIALIGLNGAGKTTLLRVLNGAFQPTAGRVEARGRMQSLLNASIGFMERATVVENVFLRGTAMGLRKRQLEPVLLDILEFAGLTERAHYRLHDLSAGQKTRLGFAISTAVQPDILLMDEWIVTGDAAFISRAQERLMGRFRGSSIVVLASHSTQLLRELCNKALVLDKGQMRFFGPISEGVEIYRELVQRSQGEMRRQTLQPDPLLFGEIAGLIERVSLRPGRLEIEGWAAGERRAEVDRIHVEVAGRRFDLTSFERVAREDVARHLGKQGRFGFKLAIPLGSTNLAENITTALSVRIPGRGPGSTLALAAGAIVDATPPHRKTG